MHFYGDTGVTKANQIRKTKTLIDFEKNKSNSIKSLAVKGNAGGKVASRFLKNISCDPYI